MEVLTTMSGGRGSRYITRTFQSSRVKTSHTEAGLGRVSAFKSDPGSQQTIEMCLESSEGK